MVASSPEKENCYVYYTTTEHQKLGELFFSSTKRADAIGYDVVKEFSVANAYMCRSIASNSSTSSLAGISAAAWIP